MKIQDLKLVHNKNYPHIGRCVHCDARDFCGIYKTDGTRLFGCNANMKQHYKNISKERKLKLEKLNDIR